MIQLTITIQLVKITPDQLHAETILFLRVDWCWWQGMVSALSATDLTSVITNTMTETIFGKKKYKNKQNTMGASLPVFIYWQFI